jgi:hypothetical protein
VTIKREAAAADAHPGLFGTGDSFKCVDTLGKTGQIRTPCHLRSERSYYEWGTGSDAAPVSTIAERRLFNRLMLLHPGVGSTGGASWNTILDAWNMELITKKSDIYGKTIDQLIKHHSVAWNTISAKLKAEREGNDGLNRL